MVVRRIGACRARDGGVVKAEDLALGAAQLTREHPVRHPPALAPDDVVGEADQPGDARDERVAGRRNAAEPGQADEIVRQGEALGGLVGLGGRFRPGERGGRGGVATEV